jgi:hypothetical protein
MQNLSPSKIDTACDPEIQKRRGETEVSCAQGGTLHDYVPFYFTPHSPMLLQSLEGHAEWSLVSELRDARNRWTLNSTSSTVTSK